MSMEVVAFTSFMLPVYLALRWPFFRLPLHIDTGFYVSNHTICTQHINFSKGWNANFAGCSKVLPEYFYSVIYLLHGGEKYKFYSRFYYSLYNYITAIFVGCGSYMVAGSDEMYYYLGLVIYCLLSSEPHYGVYFENAEQFELSFQVVGLLLLYGGLLQANGVLVGAGIGLWVLESFFVKLSSIGSTAVLAAGVAILLPASIPFSLLFGLAAGLLWIGWVLANGRNPLLLFQPLVGHETYFAHNISLHYYARQALDKWRFLLNIIQSQPIIPCIALLGFVPASRAAPFFLLVLLAIGMSYIFQAAGVWYYAIPFLPVWSLLAALASGWLLKQGTNGIILVIMLMITWLGNHILQSYGRLAFRGLESLNRYTWRPHGEAMAAKNLALEGAASAIRSQVNGHRLFIFGAWNQAYVLLGTSYETPIISAVVWLDEIKPGWWRELNQQLVHDPPQYLLDTDNCLNFQLLEHKMGLEYQLIDIQPPSFRLLKLVSYRPVVGCLDLDARPYNACQKAGINEVYNTI